MTSSTLFLLFIIYSLIGWISEVIYCSIIERRLVNRGFLNSPLCPIYGFGALLVIFVLKPFADNLVVLFVTAVAVTTLLEYLAGWVLEHLFSTRWWDYSALPFNLHGRICLRNSLLFGLMSVAGVRLAHPVLLQLFLQVPEATRNHLAAGLAILLALDLAVTLKTLVGLGFRLRSLREYIDLIGDRADLAQWFNESDLAGSITRLRALIPAPPELDSIRETAEQAAARAAAKTRERLAVRLEQLSRRSGDFRRIFSAFPAMRSRLHNRHLSILKNLHRRRD